MRVALGQFAVSREWQQNASTCVDLMAKATTANADLLVLPEGILARDIADPDIVQRSAQALDGPFMQQLLAANAGSNLTVMTCIHVPAMDGLIWNIQIAIRNGKLITQYKKLHLYDAFAVKESENVMPGNTVPELIEVAGFKIGLMTCYDVRFPELARHLALDGAQVLVLPAAWVKGPLKEEHWELMVKARALENTCYVVAVGECGERNIGKSMVIDPLGVAIVSAAEGPSLMFAEIEQSRLNYAREILPVLANRRFKKPELN